MKRLILCLLLAATLLLPGCRDAESAAPETGPMEPETRLDILLTEPPVLTLRSGSREASRGSGNYSWEYAGENGLTNAVIACGAAAPGSLWEGEPTLTAEEEQIQLLWDVVPDSVSVRCWSTARSTETWNVEFPAEYREGILILNPQCQVYEITASWDRDAFSGTAGYTVCILQQN